MPPFLITQRGPEIGRRYDLNNTQFTMGRGHDNDLVLGDAQVSRYHAVIRQENEGVVIIDLGSTNPVVVNESPLEPGAPQRLQHRDIITLGQSVFCYQNFAAAPSAPARGVRSGEPATMMKPADGGAQPVRAEPAWDGPRTRDLAVRACYDCHSNQTVWPWYSHVAPVSWLVQFDVDKGRREVNYSEWDRPQREAAESAEQVQQGKMPQWYYVATHPEARLAAAEREALIQGLEAIFGREGRRDGRR